MYTKEEFREFALFVNNSTTNKKAAITTILSVAGNELRFYQMYEFMKNNPKATFYEIQYKINMIVFEECVKEQEERKKKI